MRLQVRFLISIGLLMVLTIIAFESHSSDGTFCNVERRDFYRGWRDDWPAQCGRRPDAGYLADLRADCAATRARIAYDLATGHVGSWPANWGAYGEETCLAMEFGNAL